MTKSSGPIGLFIKQTFNYYNPSPYKLGRWPATWWNIANESASKPEPAEIRCQKISPGIGSSYPGCLIFITKLLMGLEHPGLPRIASKSCTQAIYRESRSILEFASRRARPQNKSSTRQMASIFYSILCMGLWDCISHLQREISVWGLNFFKMFLLFRYMTIHYTK